MAISHDTTRAQMPTITGLVPGQDGNSRIFGKMRTWRWQLTIRAQVVLAGGPSTIINRGRLAALFQFIGINENGTKYQWDARAMAGLSDAVRQGMPGQIHLTSGANGTYQLVDQVFIDCAWPFSPRGWETAWREKDPNAITQIFVTPWAGTGTTGVTTGVGFLVAAGAGTAAITNLSITVEQVFDQMVNVAPLFRPRFDNVQQVIAASGTDLPQIIPVNSLLRAMVIQQDTNVGEVSDIITGFQFQTDTQKLEGYGTDLVFTDEVLAQSHQYPGTITANALATALLGAGAIPSSWPNPAQLIRDYQGARLSQALNLIPNTPGFAGPNFQGMITGQPSVTSGATSSIVRYNLFKLERVEGVTAAVLPQKFGWGK